jgi:dienelactone hydrolase
MYATSQSQLTFSSGGKTIHMDAYLPEAAGELLPAVIGLHGSGGNHSSMAEPASMLASRGFAVYVPHYFERTGTTTVADKATIFRHFFAWMKTLWETVSLVAAQPQVDPVRIGLLGFSLGAYLSLSAAGIDSRVCAVVDFFGGLPKEMKLFTRRFCPVLILHGALDETVPVEEAYSLQEFLERKKIPYELKIYPEAGHGFEGEIWLDAQQRTLAFLKKYLRAADEQPPA